jgi:diaminohydroxyphosphoribosylaminopyrimidine deaminase/5-amino-6-(5-phosphoribosylamino)uracil reductase
MTDDEIFMGLALGLAKAQLGRTAPNPTVGCVIVREGTIIAQGVTGDGGRPHAEELALSAIGQAARGTIAYVTLEPCAARSSGAASCSERLISAGVAKVVCAVGDPHEKAAGQGLARLRAAGIEVVEGVLAREAATVNAGFFSVVRHGIPLVAIDAEAWRYDAEFAPNPDEPLQEALERAAREGLTRLYVRPGSALANRLRESDII